MYRVDTFRMANIKGVFGTGKYFPRFLRRRPDARLDELPPGAFIRALDLFVGRYC